MNANAKHTPGPWAYGEECGLTREIWGDNGPELYAIAQTRHGDPGQCEANARLIAAAPELLEALISMIEAPVYFSAVGAEKRKKAREKARYAITKATGG